MRSSITPTFKSRAAFYLKLPLCLIWFVIAVVITFVAALIRWRHPSNGYIFTQLFTKGITFIIGMKIVIHHQERLLKHQPCIYIGNHQSMLDVLVHSTCYQTRTVAIGKKEILWVPFFGFLFYLCSNILIDRKHHERAMRSMAMAKHWLQNRRISIYMFPEGTRNKDLTELLPFKKGAFYLAIHAQVPLLPVVASPIGELVDLKQHSIRQGTINIEVLEPIPTTGLDESHVDELIHKTRVAMQSAFERTKTVLKSES
ncbi:MAG: 1-acyl-sn-glycerol-3-phosphate acyltransferase [Oligoflexia bacterium]|nr:1-acyl-sn-glycerol-3-phosphate acyltransferase [Oligoflexia bacterium]